MDDAKTDQIPVIPDTTIPSAVTSVPSVGVSGKETEVVAVPEFMRPSDRIDIHKEAAEAGLKESNQQPELDRTHVNAGITHSEPSIESVISKPTTVNFKTPLTNEEMITAPKRNIFDAVRWLASSISRQFKRAMFNKQKQQTASGQV
ncbi:MAG: hypothetical protein AAB521_01050 [Patescibacteria group bacterium]